jgi:hypothetical protein
MHAMLLTRELLGDIPVVGSGLAGYVLAALDVAAHLSAVVATDIGTHHAAHDNTTDGGDVPTAAATDLVAEDAADQSTDDRAGEVRAASHLNDLFAFDPASLYGCSNDRAH